MTTFVLEINPETREELYSDIGEVFIGFVLIEALHNILLVKRPGILGVLDQIEFPLDLPDDHPEIGLAENVGMEVDTSVEYLLEILKGLDVAVGAILPDDDYEYGSYYYEIVMQKLAIAITSIEECNQPSQLHSLSEIFGSPKYASGFSFKVVHYPDRVVVVLSPKMNPLGMGKPSDSLAALLNGGDPEGNQSYFYEEEVLQMSEEATMSAITRMLGGGY
jgi:hypothetical protein